MSHTPAEPPGRPCPALTRLGPDPCAGPQGQTPPGNAAPGIAGGPGAARAGVPGTGRVWLRSAPARGWSCPPVPAPGGAGRRSPRQGELSLLLDHFGPNKGGSAAFPGCGGGCAGERAEDPARLRLGSPGREGPAPGVPAVPSGSAARGGPVSASAAVGAVSGGFPGPCGLRRFPGLPSGHRPRRGANSPGGSAAPGSRRDPRAPALQLQLKHRGRGRRRRSGTAESPRLPRRSCQRYPSPAAVPLCYSSLPATTAN